MTEPLEQMYGRLISVDQVVLGSVLTQAAGIASTVLHVEDVSDFNEDGGQVYVGEVLYDYDAIDEDAGTISLSTPGGLQVAAAEDDVVAVFDPLVNGRVVDYVGLVLLDDQDPGDEPIEVSVQHALVDLLQETIRGGAAESVALIRDGEDDWTVWQVDGKLAINLAVDKVKTDIDVVLDEVAEDLLELNEVTLPALQQDLAGLEGMFPITSVNISDNAITAPKIAANSVSADKIVANAVSADKLAANSVSADKIVANSITGDKIAANTITGDKIQANAIDGKTITGATLRTASSGERVEVTNNSTGHIRFYATDGSTIGALRPWSGSIPASRGVQLLVGSGLPLAIEVMPNHTSFMHDVDVFGSLRTTANVEGDLYAKGGDTTDPINCNVNGSTGRVRRSTAASSRAYKENIQPLGYSLEQILAPGPVSFDYKPGMVGDGSGTGLVGLIYEDVEEAGLAPLLTSEGDRKALRYDRLPILHQHALRLLLDRADCQDTRIADLEQQVADQEQRLVALEAAVAALTTPTGSEA